MIDPLLLSPLIFSLRFGFVILTDLDFCSLFNFYSEVMDSAIVSSFYDPSELLSELSSDYSSIRVVRKLMFFSVAVIYNY